MVEHFAVRGGARLVGSVDVVGAKNSVLKLMAAALLAEGTTTITNCPEILDVPLMADVLRVVARFDGLAEYPACRSYVARATTAGTFIRPPAQAVEMYNPAVQGRSDGGVLVVKARQARADSSEPR